MTIVMSSAVKRPARPRDLKLRRTSSCSALTAGQFAFCNVQAFSSASGGCAQEEEKPAIPAVITEEFVEDEHHPVIHIEPELEPQASVAAYCSPHRKQKSKSFHLPPRISVSCDESDNGKCATSSQHGRRKQFVFQTDLPCRNAIGLGTRTYELKSTHCADTAHERWSRTHQSSCCSRPTLSLLPGTDI